MPSKIALAKTAPTVEDAEAEAAEAAGLVLALEESIRSGDGSVSPSDLTKAREMAEFATLQCEAARRRVVDAEREAAAQAVQIACAEAHELAVEGTGKVESLRTAAAAAFGAYVDALEDVSYRTSQVRERVTAVNLRADHFGIDKCNNFGVWCGTTELEITTKDSVLVTMPVGTIKPQYVVAGIVADAGFVVAQPYASTTAIESKRPWPPGA